MTISYAVRLVCVSLAAFAVIFLAVGAMVSLCAGMARRYAERLNAVSAAGMVLALRLLPAGLAAFLVAAVCVPSYVRYEPREEFEQAGKLCLVLAMGSACLMGAAARRAFRAWRQSSGAQVKLLALVGVLRPRIVVSEAARSCLAAAELAAAMRHEECHAASRDNLKRLLILLAPGPFPGFRALEETWKRLAEYAADDRAAAGDPQRSLSLAAALVRVAKLGVGPEAPLATPLLAGANDLESRVERLLNPRALREARFVRLPLYAAGMAAMAGMMRPETPVAVHALLERLLH
jgi:hypothetical protein